MDCEENAVCDECGEAVDDDVLDFLVIDDLINQEQEIEIEFLTGQKLKGVVLGYDYATGFLTFYSEYHEKEILVQKQSFGFIVPV